MRTFERFNAASTVAPSCRKEARVHEGGRGGRRLQRSGGRKLSLGAIFMMIPGNISVREATRRQK
jgi:hypothetical protein